MNSKYFVRLKARPVGGGEWSIYDERRAADAVRIAAEKWIGTPWARSVHAPARGTDCARFAMDIAATLSGVRYVMPRVDPLRVTLSADLSFDVLSHFILALRPEFVPLQWVEPGDVLAEIDPDGRLVHTSIVSEAPPSVYTVLQSIGAARTVLECDPGSSLLLMRLSNRREWAGRI